MFVQSRGRGYWGGGTSTPIRNLPQRYPVSGRYGQLYRYTELFAFHFYGHFSNQFPDKQPKAINIAMIGVMLMQNGYVIFKNMDNSGHFLYRQHDKKMDYVEDVNNFAKHEELIVLINVGSLLFDRKGWLTFFNFEFTLEWEFSSDNHLFNRCEQHSGSACDYGCIDKEGYERGSEGCNGFQIQVMCIGVILLWCDDHWYTV